MKIQNIATKGDIFLAPMAGFTDAAFRAICASQGAAVCYTEMISAKGLKHGNANTKTLCLAYEEEQVKACQIFGGESDVMAEAAVNPALAHFDIVDINMGCPVPKVTKCGEGSALMSNPKTAYKVISAVAGATSRPVTVKFRRGYRGVDNAVEFAKMCEDAGAAALTVHPRFSEQMYSGTADLDTIKKVASAVKIPVIASGDVVDKQSYLRAREIASAVMIGRAAVGNPWIFDFASPDREEVVKTILRQIEILQRDFSERYILTSMRPHILAYLKKMGLKSAQRKDIFAALCKITNTQNLQDFIANL